MFKFKQLQKITIFLMITLCINFYGEFSKISFGETVVSGVKYFKYEKYDYRNYKLVYSGRTSTDYDSTGRAFSKRYRGQFYTKLEYGRDNPNLSELQPYSSTYCKSNPMYKNTGYSIDILTGDEVQSGSSDGNDYTSDVFVNRYMIDRNQIEILGKVGEVIAPDGTYPNDGISISKDYYYKKVGVGSVSPTLSLTNTTSGFICGNVWNVTGIFKDSDANRPVSVKYKIEYMNGAVLGNSENVILTQNSNGSMNNINLSLNLSNIANGQYRLKLWATDDFYFDSNIISYNMTVNHTPVLNALNGNSQVIKPNKIVSILGNYLDYDLNEVVRIDYALDLSDGSKLNVLTGNMGSKGNYDLLQPLIKYNKDIDFNSVPPGRYKLRVWATDTVNRGAAKSNEESLLFQVGFGVRYIDPSSSQNQVNSAPNITVTSPTSGTKYLKSVQINVNANVKDFNDDTLECKLYIDESQTVKEMKYVSGTNVEKKVVFTPLTLSNLNVGNHSLRIVVSDGLLASESTINFIVYEQATEYIKDLKLSAGSYSVSSEIVLKGEANAINNIQYGFEYETGKIIWQKSPKFIVKGLLPSKTYSVTGYVKIGDIINSKKMKSITTLGTNVSSTYQYDSGNKLILKVEPTKSNIFRYDDNGNLNSIEE